MNDRMRLPAGGAAGYPQARSRSYPGRPDQATEVRAFLARVLDGCPAAADVILMADEIAANAVLHSRSGEPGGQFTVRVEICEPEWIWVAVADEGGSGAPRLRGGNGGAGGETAGHDPADGGPADDGGRGLRIVDALADTWGVNGGAIGRTVWFRSKWNGG